MLNTGRCGGICGRNPLSGSDIFPVAYVRKKFVGSETSAEQRNKENNTHGSQRNPRTL
jgi:hypothetical protein